MPVIRAALLTCFFLSSGCENQTRHEPLLVLGGLTMGTSYTVKINEPALTLPRSYLQRGIDDILEDVNDKMSTYIDDSELSLINKSKSQEWIGISEDLHGIISDAMEISDLTSGSFDITVGPLVNLWGFGPTGERKIPGPSEITAALSHTGIKHLKLRDSPAAIRKDLDEIYIDLSGIAKGFGVDRIAMFLEQEKIENYLVEIGGEIRASGVNEIGFAWRIGIEQPTTGKRSVQRVIKLDKIAMATSGDYRNYFEENGKRFSHTINPASGLPVTHTLASVTVLHEYASWADALATAFLVMGKDAAYKIAEREKIAVLFLERLENGFGESYTTAFSSNLLDN